VAAAGLAAVLADAEALADGDADAVAPNADELTFVGPE
jgi:hypothetical protein